MSVRYVYVCEERHSGTHTVRVDVMRVKNNTAKNSQKASKAVPLL